MISFASPIVEAIVGEKEFLKIYFGSGIVGGILYIIVCNVFGSHGIAIGASGAIAGLLGFLAVVRPNIQVFFYMIPMNIVLGTLLFIVISLVLIISAHPNAFGIAHAAHLGGVLFGIYYGFEKIREKIEYF
jgi:membrane associated rhomboid family serine protease